MRCKWNSGTLAMFLPYSPRLLHTKMTNTVPLRNLTPVLCPTFLEIGGCWGSEDTAVAELLRASISKQGGTGGSTS